jgi:hypothetical protein
MLRLLVGAAVRAGHAVRGHRDHEQASHQDGDESAHRFSIERFMNAWLSDLAASGERPAGPATGRKRGRRDNSGRTGWKEVSGRYPIPQAVGFGMWEWNSRSKEIV